MEMLGEAILAEFLLNHSIIWTPLLSIRFNSQIQQVIECSALRYCASLLFWVLLTAIWPQCYFC